MTSDEKLDSQVTKLYAAIVDIFDLKHRSGERGWNYIRQHLSDDQVRELYTFIAQLWPESLDANEFIPEPDPKKLRAFYIGNTHPEHLNTRIARYALYTDEIILTLPFLNPYNVTPDFNPIFHPDKFKQDMLICLAYMLKAMPWFERGKVRLLPNPIHYNHDIFQFVFNPDRERERNVKREDYIQNIDNETEADLKREYFRQTLLRMPRASIIQTLRKEYANLPPAERDEMIAVALRMKKEDKYVLDQGDLPQSEYAINRVGAPNDVGEMLCHMMGSYMYTDNPMQWRQILDMQTNKSPEATSLWSPLTMAFQKLDFRFLDKVDPEFASTVAAEGRLASFRNYIRNIWLEASAQNDGKEIADSTVRLFTDQLNDEYHKAQKDWDAIDQQLIKFSSAGITTTIGTMAAGKLNPIIPLGGLASTAILQLVASTRKRKQFKQTVPMAVFLDLAKKNA